MSIKAESIFIGITSMEMEVNTSDYVHATVQPTNATDKEICWESNRPEIVSINLITGQFYANKTGDATITAFLYSDPSIKKSFDIHVKGYTPVESISFPVSELSMDVNTTMSLNVLVKPSNATNKKVTWRSCCPEIASVSSIGIVTAISPGIVEIYATTNDGNLTAKCEIWIRGKTPVFLIHGRTSNSQVVWGVSNNIPSTTNDESNPTLYAEAKNGNKYIAYESQKIIDVKSGNSDNEDKPQRLGYELEKVGYKRNVNLFAFNYPNQDAVKYCATKFEDYINNVIVHVILEGPDEMKTCFYRTKSDYRLNNYKFNIIGHSMGGLVGRYFIENLGNDKYVDKLITICTPHWGSGFGELSNAFGTELHVICDHDLSRDSKMYGGNNSISLNCHGLLSKCYTENQTYYLTNELLYSKSRNTKYYAIAGIAYDATLLEENDTTLEMPSHFTNYNQIIDFMTDNYVYKLGSGIDISIIKPLNPFDEGDNMVGFLSQIGWTEDSTNGVPSKRINFHKIFIDIDTNGGNNIGDRLHNKIPCRTKVISKVISYLNDTSTTTGNDNTYYI